MAKTLIKDVYIDYRRDGKICNRTLSSVRELNRVRKQLKKNKRKVIAYGVMWRVI